MPADKCGLQPSEYLRHNPITDIEKNSVKNNIFWKMGAFKTDHRFIQSLKSQIIPRSEKFCDRTVFIGIQESCLDFTLS